MCDRVRMRARSACVSRSRVFRGSFVVLKFTFVVDIDTTLRGAHADTVACSPTVLNKCSICSCPHSLTRTPPKWLRTTIHDNKS